MLLTTFSHSFISTPISALNQLILYNFSTIYLKDNFLLGEFSILNFGRHHHVFVHVNAHEFVSNIVNLGETDISPHAGLAHLDHLILRVVLHVLIPVLKVIHGELDLAARGLVRNHWVQMDLDQFKDICGSRKKKQLANDHIH